MSVRASYDLKIDRAEHHLNDLNRRIDRWAARKPYKVTSGREGQSDRARIVHRFVFTRQPPESVAVIAGDFLYNLRSALDHLASALVPSQNRSRTYFPILWQGVWEPGIKGEDRQRTDDRLKWITFTQGMDPAAVAVLKRNQPPDLGRDVNNPHPLSILNRLRNRDTHQRLVATATSLRGFMGTGEMPDGSIYRSRPLDFNEGPEDGAILGLPSEVVNVKIDGTPLVLLSIGDPPLSMSVQDLFRGDLLIPTRNLVDRLRQFDRL